MANDWAGLDDSMDESQNLEEGVQYIGMVEDNEPEQPVRTPRRPVQRVAPVSSSYPAQRPVVAPGGVRRRTGREEPLIYYPTATGAQLALNAEAVNNIRRAKPQSINGQPAYRIQPGQYVMVVPGRGPAPRVDESSAGTFDDLLNSMATTTPGGSTRSRDVSGVGTFDISTLTNILDPLAELGIGIATTVTGAQQAQRRDATERLRIQTEADAATAARSAAADQAERVHQETMERIRQGTEDLQALQQQQAQAASSILPSTGGGTSPVVWVLLAVVGLGGIGGLIWFLSSKKSEKKD